MSRGALLALALTFFAGCDQRLEVGKRIVYDKPEDLCDLDSFDNISGCNLRDAEIGYDLDCCGGPLKLQTCGAGTTCRRPKADGFGICTRPEDAAMIEAVCIWPYEIPGDPNAK